MSHGLLAIALACLASPNAGAEEGYRVGVSKAEFALPARVPLAGYSRRDGKPSTGVRDPVGARALVLRRGYPVAALVSADLLIIDEKLYSAVRRELTGRGWSEEAALLIAATHTHSGPGAYGRRFFEKISMGHYDPDVFERIVETIADVVMAADASAAPAMMASATAEAPEFLVNRMEDGGGIDPELIVVGWWRPEAEAPFAVLMTYSAHPTVLGPSNMQLSAEYPGAAMREVERLVPGSTALFFAGAVGDQGPAKGGDAGARVQEIGAGLAERAVASLRGASPQAIRTIGTHEERMILPEARVRIGAFTLPRWLGSRLVDDDATLPIIASGEIQFIGVPCDLASPLGLRLKEAARARGRQPVIIGFANDYIGYCIPEAWYRSDEYEAGMAFNGPKTGELVTERLVTMIDALASIVKP